MAILRVFNIGTYFPSNLFLIIEEVQIVEDKGLKNPNILGNFNVKPIEYCIIFILDLQISRVLYEHILRNNLIFSSDNKHPQKLRTFLNTL